MNNFPKEFYEHQSMFPIDDETYKALEQRRLKKLKHTIKTNGGYGIKLDTRDNLGDGIEIMTGYNLSSVWAKLSHQKSLFYPYSIPLPKQKRSNLAVSYSRTNLLEIERIIKTYLRGNEFFLENCCGWSTFSTMAAYFGYNGIGCDIWDTALEYSKQQYEAIKGLPNIGDYQIMNCDGMNLPFNDNTFDYVYCNPPFLDIELYSGKENDIADGDFDMFLNKLTRLLSENFRVLKKGMLCTMTINDKRDNGKIIPMQKYLIDCAFNVGFQLHDFVIAENPTGGSMIMRKREYKYRRTAKMHEYVITFQK